MYFEANSVVPAKQKAVFLIVIGTKNYTLLSNYYAPDQPKDQTLENLIATLETHLEPEPIFIAERFLFYKWDQKPGESISDFVAELRRLTANCQFGAHLDDALRDRFVCGIYIESIQKELLTKKTLSMEEAVKLALSLSSAEKTSHAMHDGKLLQTSTAVHSMHRPSSSSSSRPNGMQTHTCYRCGKPQDRCHFKTATCHSCGKIGHIAPVCKSRKPVNHSICTENTRKDPRKDPRTFWKTVIGVKALMNYPYSHSKTNHTRQ